MKKKQHGRRPAPASGAKPACDANVIPFPRPRRKKPHAKSGDDLTLQEIDDIFEDMMRGMQEYAWPGSKNVGGGAK
ncbi:hypothetical protein AB1M95_16430 [Sulfitobacter sp. LCG007]